MAAKPLDQLQEIFRDTPVEELRTILFRHGENVEEAAWAILNGEKADPAAAAASRREVPAADASASPSAADGGLLPATTRRSAPHAAAYRSIRDSLRKLDRKRMKKLGAKLQKLNVAKLIDELERDQGIADDLERINRDNEEERQRMDMVREAEEACMREMRDHLAEFVRERPDATYEMWIEELHPENTSDGRLLHGLGKEIDHRFYVEESDHRRMWNENLTAGGGARRYVPARCLAVGMPPKGAGAPPPPVDLLSGDNDARAQLQRDHSVNLIAFD